MKTSILTAGLCIFALSLQADTLQIGSFILPYRFEDDNISDIVRHVATNDVQAFCTSITGFRKPYLDKNGNTCVQRVNTPDTTFYRPAVFFDGIKFYIENGQTNCIIKSSLTSVAKAMESELPSRTNLVHGARLFINSIMDGSITNESIANLRMFTRVYKNGTLYVANEEDCPEDAVRQNYVDMREHAVFFPPCILDSAYRQSGTNSYLFVWAGYDIPNEPNYARSIAAFPFVFADGHWCICFE